MKKSVVFIEPTRQFATRHGIDTVQFMILTPFTGTRCFEHLVAGSRILHKNKD